MATSRETFVVQVHEDGGAVIENLRTRECVWLSRVSEIAPQITRSLDDRERDRSVASTKPPGGTT